MSGDPYIISRCLIYNTYSFIQRDRLICAFKTLKYLVHPYIRKYFSNKRESDAYQILKGMYKSASDHYYFKRNQLKKSTAFGNVKLNHQINGLKRKILNNVSIIVS